ncbi:MAG: phospholipid carrier-dependent glycosyltransferase [Anaerolineales bacterium]|nr:phospholipid carrier-dependent glycosyltransferase [Anaerolineales bacterium]
MNNQQTSPANAKLSSSPHSRLTSHASRLTILLVLLLAAFLRLFQLPTLPPGLNFDEAGSGVAALEILSGVPKIWWRLGGGQEPLWPYLGALSTACLGNIPLTLRLPAALTGILTVAAVYKLLLTLRLGAQQESRLIALLTALSLALSAWHLHFSRLGFRAILLPLFSTLAFYFLWRSLISRQKSVISNQKSEVRSQKSDFTHHASRITHHASRITHHASRITHHASRITHHAIRHLGCSPSPPFSPHWQFIVTWQPGCCPWFRCSTGYFTGSSKK